MADRLYDRLTPLVKNEIITKNEIDKIAGSMRAKKVNKTLSFLHLDMRHVNMIYNSGQIFILDAENCEFGDPLFELAVIDVENELNSSLLAEYTSIYGENPNIESELFYLYKMERQALVTHLFANVIKNDTQLTKFYLERFYEVKGRLL